MNILAFDTCFSACSAAVSGGPAGGIVSEHRLLETGHAEALLPMIERVMRAAGIAFSDLDRIVVTNGPGTFTGVRTAVAAARALALATRAEIVAVSSLCPIARAAIDAHSIGAQTGILVAMDARKGDVYAQVFDGAGNALTEPQVSTPAVAVSLMPDTLLLAIGNVTSAVTSAAIEAGRQMALISPDADATLNTKTPDAKFLLAVDSRQASQQAGPGAVRPLYLRAPDAKPQSDKALPWSKP